MRKKFKIIAISAALFVGVFAVGATQYSDVLFQIKKNFTIFSEVYRQVTLRYVDKVDPEKLMRKGINSMLETLDPYTVLIDESENQQIDILTTGKYGGVGIEAGSRGGKIVVIAPIEGYSAQKKGVKAGDVITSVNGISVDELTPEDVQSLLHGEPGTTVKITIKRYGLDQELTFELKREYIEVKNVAFAGLIGKEHDIGYIVLTRFSQNTSEEIRNAILRFKSQTKLRGLILDLRNNPGGLLNEAVKTVDKFIEPGIKVVETRGRNSENNSVFKSEEPPLLVNTPLVVLQNSGSASASEVVAGSLQDLDRAVIIGEQSFGKGLVQVIRPLSYNTALKITTSKYYIPSGRSIQSVTYTHDANSSHYNKPDSVKKAYKTRDGRTVYDSQGINPDIDIKEREHSLLQIALLQNSYYFFYANKYTAQHDSLTINQVDDTLFNDFKQYLNSQHFSYETRTEQDLDQLKIHLASTKMKNSGNQYINGLQQMIEQEKEREFKKQSDEIKKLLYLELVSRYKGRSGQIRASSRFDSYIQSAEQLLHHPGRYHAILSGKE